MKLLDVAPLFTTTAPLLEIFLIFARVPLFMSIVLIVVSVLFFIRPQEK